MGVPFVFFLQPQTPEEAAQSKTGSRRVQVNATMQIKCTDATLLARERTLLDVTFMAGSLPPRQALRHDFATHMVCTPSSGDQLWELSAATGTKCVLRVDLSPVCQ